MDPNASKISSSVNDINHACCLTINSDNYIEFEVAENILIT